MNTAWLVSEGNEYTGLGHIYRSLVLAEYLKPLMQVKWLLPTDHRLAHSKVMAQGFDILCYPDLQALKALLQTAQPMLYIFDLMNYEAPLLAVIANLKSLKVCFGLLPIQAEGVDITINAADGSACNRIWHQGCQTHFQGPRYVCLRPAFLYGNHQHSYRARLKRYLLMFGAADPADLTRRVMAQIRAETDSISLTAIFGAAYPVKRKLPENLPVDWNIVQNNSMPEEYMQAADFILCSPGNTFFEALALKTPVLALLQNERQTMDFQGFNYVLSLDNIGNLHVACQKLYDDYATYVDYADQLAVGQGYSDIIGEIQQRIQQNANR